MVRVVPRLAFATMECVRCCSGAEVVIRKDLYKLMESSVAHFGAAAFSWVREPATVQRVRDIAQAVADPTWKHHFRFVSWLSGWAGALQVWTAGCGCHGRQGGQDAPVAPRLQGCWYQTRWLPEVHAEAARVLRVARSEASGWVPSDYEGKRRNTYAAARVRPACLCTGPETRRRSQPLAVCTVPSARAGSAGPLP